MLLADVVATSEVVAATSKRTAKVAALAGLLVQCAPEEVDAVVGFLIGAPRQGRIGVGWATLAAAADLDDTEPAQGPPVSVADLDRELSALAATSGPGSSSARQKRLGALFARMTPTERRFTRRLLTGELRQGASGGLMADAGAMAADVPAALLRRAAMLGGDLGSAISAALGGGAPALATVGLRVLRPVLPMLAASSPSVTEALLETGPASVEWKLDGARVQVHREDDTVIVVTRNLNDVTDRLPAVVAAARSLPVRTVVLDGEVLGLDADGRPHVFQDTMSTFGSEACGTPRVDLRPWFFDVLHVDGRDLLDEPLDVRLAELDRIAAPWRIPALVDPSPERAEAFLHEAIAAGHEGVMVKAQSGRYEAGRRGAAWRKVKPVRTLDLVVLGAEWGHGRRTGWLSNLHLGARADGGNGYVMVGKTFKGMTDELLRWQTAELEGRAVSRSGHTVFVRPELVVEIALDGVQVSRRYTGGVALRFARVRGYRPDKDAMDADTLATVRRLLPPGADAPVR